MGFLIFALRPTQDMRDVFLGFVKHVLLVISFSGFNLAVQFQCRLRRVNVFSHPSGFQFSLHSWSSSSSLSESFLVKASIGACANRSEFYYFLASSFSGIWLRFFSLVFACFVLSVIVQCLVSLIHSYSLVLNMDTWIY